MLKITQNYSKQHTTTQTFQKRRRFLEITPSAKKVLENAHNYSNTQSKHSQILPNTRKKYSQILAEKYPQKILANNLLHVTFR